jgi:Thoeris protein ThsA, Macro domain
MRHLRAHFARRSGRRRLLAAFVSAFGGIWLVLEPAALFFPDVFKWGWPGYVGIVFGSAVAAFVVARPRSVVSRSLPPTDVAITIQVGDVLAQEGNVIVGANDTFDTQLEQDVISHASVQGQLLQRVFDGDRADLDRQIEASVVSVAGCADDTKLFGKHVRYPIGTVAVARRGRARYFLPAFTHMSATLPAHVSSTIEDLEVALAGTWRAINAAGQREPVHAPIIGSHLARLGVSRTLLTQMIILSFIAATRTGGPSRLTIWIAPQDRDVIDMVVLDDWLHGLCAV